MRTGGIQDDFSLRQEKPRQVQLLAVEIPLPADDILVNALQKVPFTQRQLLVIAVLVVSNILILIALLLVILALSQQNRRSKGRLTFLRVRGIFLSAFGWVRRGGSLRTPSGPRGSSGKEVLLGAVG